MKRTYTITMFLSICVCLLSTNSLDAQNMIQNPGFETGIAAPWVSGNDGSVTVVEEPYEGNYAAFGNVEQYIDLEAGVNYTYSCYVKTSTPDINVWIGIRDMVGAALVSNYQFSHTEYDLATIEFTAPSTGSHRFWVWGQGGSQYHSDNFLLLKEGTTGIFDREVESDKIKISSNNEGVVIDVEQPIQEARLTIHDLSGKEIYTQAISNGNTQVHKSEFSSGSGVFVVSVTTENTRNTSKIGIANY